MKEIKKTIKRFALSSVGGISTYLSISFVKLDFSIVNMTEDLRMYIAMVASVYSILFWTVTLLNEADKKKFEKQRKEKEDAIKITS